MADTAAPENSEAVHHERVMRPPRFSVQLLVTNLTQLCLIKNLSSRGAFVEALPTPGHETFELEFGFPGRKRVYQVCARIVRYQKLPGEEVPPPAVWGAGIQFLSFSQGTAEELLQDLLYWGELRKARGPKQPFSGKHRGCTQRTPNTEVVPYLAAIDDNEIDTALNSFLKNVTP